MDAAEADAAELLGSPRGRVRISAPHSLGSTVLPSVISIFLQEYPAVKLDLHLDDRRSDLLAEGFDAAIRVGELVNTSLVTRALAPLELVVCAAPDYLGRRGKPVSLADLASHDCLDFNASATPGVWNFETSGGIVGAVVSGPLQANSGFALRAAALQGLGIIMQPKVLLKDDIESGLLVRLLTAYRPQSRPVQLLTLPGRRLTPKLRCFVDVLVRQLGSSAGK